ncbi:MAG: transcriptional regulator [Ferruginibacter sp.]|uniref:helix-turn-helix domain-containing protein n=1 Tax=Ferruginibacter sp. TaxID=1940288 RepID=UPI002659B8EC|nr:helix-turn-helix transcriptional regulator [Ferruginibacter sp.]MDB5279053.1 transcriptional regulator [Ferruginibacter sp.]
MDDIRVRVGRRLKELRLKIDLTQEKLSFKAEVDKTYLNEVENGKRNVSIINLEKIIKALDSSFEDFFKGMTS